VQEYEASQRLGPDFDYVSIIKSIRANRSSYRQSNQEPIVRPPIERLCSGCQKRQVFYEFPNIKSAKCFTCHYSKQPKDLLNKKLKIVETYKNSQWLGSDFDYDSIIQKLHEEKAQASLTIPRPVIAAAPSYKCEVPLAKVLEYLQQCHKNHVKAKFYYKNQSYTREVDIQILNEIYLTGQTSVGRRTFRIDRITKI